MTRLMLAACFTAVIGVAHAQSTAPANPPGAGGSGVTTPTPTPDRGIADPAVIHPGNPDPGITVQPPAAGLTPVLPPPGSGPAAPLVVPK